MSETFLLDKNNNSVFFPGYEYDHGEYNLALSPSNKKLLSSSSIDLKTFKDYYDFRSYIVIYNMSNINYLNEIKNALVFTTKDWELIDIDWLDDNSLILKVKTVSFNNSNEEFEYLKAEIK